MFSKRIKSIKPSAIVKYNNLVKRREKQGTIFLKANIGQPDFKTNKQYFKSLKKINKNLTNGYSMPNGIEELRYAVSTYYNNVQNNIVFNSKDIVVTQGASDAIIKILYTICDCDDEVIVLEPFFSDYKIYADILGIKLISIKYNNFSAEDLNGVFSKKTKAILFANPNNPDGAIITNNSIHILINFAKKHNLYIISDEVYSGLVYDKEFISLSSFKYRNIIIVDSASKKLNLCGSRIGYIISKNIKLLDSITILNDSKISISNVEQIAVVNMLLNSKKIIAESKKIYKKRLDILCELLKKYNIKYILPKGGISMLIELPIKDCENYVCWLINKYEFDGESLLVTPAKDFYLSNHGFNKIRLTLTISNNNLEKAVKMLDDSIKKYRGE